MHSEVFLKIVKAMIAEYINEKLDKSDGTRITDKDVYIVWSCKTLQNNKALASTTLPDGMYYEVTFDGDNSMIYLDAYKKWENIAVEIKHDDKQEDNKETES